MVTGVDALTALVVMLNVALVALAGTTTGDCTWAATLLLDRLTDMPPLGAALVSVTVPVEPCPPGTLEGLTPTDCKAGGVLVVDAPLKAMNRDELLATAVPQLIDVVALVCAEETISYAIAWRVFVAAPAVEKEKPVPATKLLLVPDWLAETSTAKIRMSLVLVVLSGPLVMLVGELLVVFTGPTSTGEEAATPEISYTTIPGRVTPPPVVKLAVTLVTAAELAM
jgi:hypothetical protein